MSIADEVRKEHRRHDCAVDPHCILCIQDWPCAAIRLADSHDELLRAAEHVEAWWFAKYGVDDIELDMDKVCAAIAKAKGVL